MRAGNDTPVNKLAALVIGSGEQPIEWTDRPDALFPSDRCPPLYPFKGPKDHDLTGQRFGQLVVVGFWQGAKKSSGSKGYGVRTSRWVVRCDCGRYEAKYTNRLKDRSATACCGRCVYIKQLLSKKEQREQAEREGGE